MNLPFPSFEQPPLASFRLRSAQLERSDATGERKVFRVLYARSRQLTRGCILPSSPAPVGTPSGMKRDIALKFSKHEVT